MKNKFNIKIRGYIDSNNEMICMKREFLKGDFSGIMTMLIYKAIELYQMNADKPTKNQIKKIIDIIYDDVKNNLENEDPNEGRRF